LCEFGAAPHIFAFCCKKWKVESSAIERDKGSVGFEDVFYKEVNVNKRVNSIIVCGDGAPKKIGFQIEAGRFNVEVGAHVVEKLILQGPYNAD
jgi:hypothetical protein